VNNVSGEQVGGPSGEEGEGGLPILSEGYVIFGPLVADRFPILSPAAVYRSICFESCHESNQLGHINEHIVVRLKEVLGFWTVKICPLQQGDSLESQVVVRIYEVSPYQISVHEILPVNSLIQSLVGGSSQDECHPHVPPAPVVHPRLPDGHPSRLMMDS